MTQLLSHCNQLTNMSSCIHDHKNETQKNNHKDRGAVFRQCCAGRVGGTYISFVETIVGQKEACPSPAVRNGWLGNTRLPCWTKHKKSLVQKETITIWLHGVRVGQDATALRRPCANVFEAVLWKYATIEALRHSVKQGPFVWTLQQSESNL